MVAKNCGFISLVVLTVDEVIEFIMNSNVLLNFRVNAPTVLL